MAKRARRSATTRRNQSRGADIGQFMRARPMLVASLGLAFGALVASLVRLTPDEKQVIGNRVRKLKEQAVKLKDGASELAIEGYVHAKEAMESKIEVASDAPKGVDRNPLIIGDGAR